MQPLTLLALLLPRLVILFLWLFSGWFSGAVTSVFWSVMGFVFMPVSLLWTTVITNVFGGFWTGLALIGLLIAVVLDVSQLQLIRSDRRA